MKSEVFTNLTKTCVFLRKRLACAFCLCLVAAIGLSSCNNESAKTDENKKDSMPPAVDSPSVAAGWKIGVQLWTFHFVSFVQALDKADSAGIKYLEAFPGQKLGGDMK